MSGSLYDSQINKVVDDFMQVWARFEAMLPRELAHLHATHLEGISSASQSQTSTNDELFYRVSSRLYPRESLTMGELSAAMAVPMSTATRIVDWMVDNKYAARLAEPHDRRVVRVTLTDSGKTLHQNISTHVSERVRHILSCLSLEERNMLFRLVGKVVSALQETPGTVTNG